MVRNDVLLAAHGRSGPARPDLAMEFERRQHPARPARPARRGPRRGPRSRAGPAGGVPRRRGGARVPGCGGQDDHRERHPHPLPAARRGRRWVCRHLPRRGGLRLLRVAREPVRGGAGVDAVLDALLPVLRRPAHDAPARRLRVGGLRGQGQRAVDVRLHPIRRGQGAGIPPRHAQPPGRARVFREDQECYQYIRQEATREPHISGTRLRPRACRGRPAWA
mmetsp:Transcript_101162/g.286770  ORF Transcript_101162/g.286770 Transcript_101162/m.286770 type:complete len:221 (-) Transcript_101162:915-1577(-)